MYDPRGRQPATVGFSYRSSSTISRSTIVVGKEPADYDKNRGQERGEQKLSIILGIL